MGFLAWLICFAALSLVAKANDTRTRCPDGGLCHEGHTCGMIGAGLYGCCPYDNAVPCGDKLHCCPQGHRCHLPSGTCVGIHGALAMVRYQHATTASYGEPGCEKPSTVMCHNHQYCPKGTKCCRTNESFEFYYCCIYGNGTCCTDGTFCCDPDYSCSYKYHVCTPKGSATFRGRGFSRLRQYPGISKSLAVPAVRANLAKTVKFERCPDGTSCYYNSSCCENGDGHYACCPYKNAQCCGGQHCCPSGFRCNDEDKTCLRDETAEPMAAKYRSFRNPEPNIDTTPSVPCPSWMICGSNSCCVNEYGAYRCSPYTDGTCCSDGQHGCPPGMICVP